MPHYSAPAVLVTFDVRSADVQHPLYPTYRSLFPNLQQRVELLFAAFRTPTVAANGPSPGKSSTTGN